MQPFRFYVVEDINRRLSVSDRASAGPAICDLYMYRMNFEEECIGDRFQILIHPVDASRLAGGGQHGPNSGAVHASARRSRAQGPTGEEDPEDRSRCDDRESFALSHTGCAAQSRGGYSQNLSFGCKYALYMGITIPNSQGIWRCENGSGQRMPIVAFAGA